ncbi:MAG: hypothetical protein OK474_07850 [Thaumarchaeota archaeon]|nr:hypothetical protein [Nitrososphaerota archaeon]
MEMAKNTSQNKVWNEEKEIEAKIEELDLMLDYLQRRKEDLLSAKMNSVEGRKHQGSMEVGSVGKLSAAQQERLAALPWKDFGAGKVGQWTFVNDRNGNLTKELEPVKDVIDKLKQGEALSVGGFRYRISENGKFLNRTPV